MSINIPLNFKVGFSKEKDVQPEKFVTASAPGNAQLDWAVAENYPDYQFSDNYKMFAWMEDVYWKYSTDIKKSQIKALQDFKCSDRVYFISKGIDYEFEIILDGEVLLYQEGMFTPVKIDLTDILKDKKDKDAATLDIIIYPAPKSHNKRADRSQADESVKPPVSYEWDWHPRLIPSGLYEECYLEVKPQFNIDDAEVRYVLTDDLSVADITLEASVINLCDENGELKWELFDKNNNLVCEYKFKADEAITGNIKHQLKFSNLELWWPSEHGEQVLYTSVFTLLSSDREIADTKKSRIGFRRCRLVMNSDAEEKTFSKTRDLPPITMEINNRRIFCKGTNWLEPEIFTGTITRETYEPLVKLAKEAHFNMFRQWGGCIVSKEAFFDLCDEYGIMVWREFPLACNNYKDIPKYLEVLDKESKSIITRVRRHACLAIWCGGNELFNSWSGMNDQSHALRLLNANCYALDRYTPFLPTSPVYGMGHGSYVFRYDDKYDCLEAMVNSNKTAYTEFGNPGASDIDTLKAIIPEVDLFPPKRGTAWQEHHAFDAWTKGAWLFTDTVEYYFGKPENLETLVGYTQMLQCIGYKGIFEEARRQWRHCSMALNWCYNEPWAAAANNSLLIYPAKPKPAYYAVKESCRQQMASARVKRFDFKDGETFDVELFILNDLPEDIQPLSVKAKLKSDSKIYDICTWQTEETPKSRHQHSGIYSVILDESENSLLRLTVEVEGRLEMNSEYLFLCRNNNSMKKIIPEMI